MFQRVMATVEYVLIAYSLTIVCKVGLRLGSFAPCAVD